MRYLGILAGLLFLAGCGGTQSSFAEGVADIPRSPVAAVKSTTTSYQNPLPIITPSGRRIESCADPTIIRAQDPSDPHWYMYCTTDPLYEGSGLHWMPISRSTDLVNWTYVGDVFRSRPPWIASDGGAWAPEVKFFNGKYYLYYAVSKTTLLPGGASAIFVATSDSPVGPWVANPNPVVGPIDPARWIFDPEIVEDEGQRYIFFGSYRGGIAARRLSVDGLFSEPDSEVQIAAADRYEGTYITRHDGYYYLMASASDCCRGPLTGYSVFAARSRNVLGPYVDADGASILDPRVGGTPVLAMNGNRWVGTGHHTMVTDAAGQDWMIYHASDMAQPYFSGFTPRRPALLDPVDWIDGWPVVRGGAGASTTAQPAPVVTLGGQSSYIPTVARIDTPGELIATASDDFDIAQLRTSWSWVRPPTVSPVDLHESVLRFSSQSGELHPFGELASILAQPAPQTDYLVEVKMATNIPDNGTLPSVQGGLVIYKDDGNYVKLVNVAIGATRQIEFGKRVSSMPAGFPQYGTSVLASPAPWTYLRIARRTINGQETYTAYSSHDGLQWRRGATWTHSLASAQIGLISMGGAGYQAFFDYVRVYTLR